MPADLLRERPDLLPEDLARAAPLFQERGDVQAIEGPFPMPEFGEEALDVASRVPLGQAQAYRLLPVHGGGGQTVEPGRRRAHAPRQKPGGPVPGNETDLHLRDLDPRGRVGDHEVRRRGDSQAGACAQAASHAECRDAQTANPVAQGLLIREKPVRPLSGLRVQAMAHHVE